jgi:lipopolysaccharide/colanic/teichoic acid biosynthesis glycosyltransferase
MIKRGFDITVSLVMLILLAPLFVAIALTVRFSSSGPILFRQQRVGRSYRPFTVLKFRTMKSGEDPNMDKEHLQILETMDDERPVSASGSDIFKALPPLHLVHNKAADQQRITSIGKFLRRTGLDELPQVFNVLIGDMSVVGPRPLVLEESKRITGWRKRRFDVRPGITGLWQVSGRNELVADDLFQLDYVYVSSWSMWWDLKIVWDTPRAMIRGLGAY